MPAFVALISKRAVVEPLQVLTVAAILLAIAGVLVVGFAAMISPLAGWANAQTLAGLVPV